MKFLLKRRLNPFLLLTTVIGLSLLAGLSIIYQTQFDEVTSEKQSLEEKLVEAEAELENKRQNTTSLETRNNELQTEVSELEEQLNNQDESAEGLESEVERLESENSELQDERNEYRSDFNTVRSDLRTICDDEDNLNENSRLICHTWNNES